MTSGDNVIEAEIQTDNAEVLSAAPEVTADKPENAPQSDSNPSAENYSQNPKKPLKTPISASKTPEEASAQPDAHRVTPERVAYEMAKISEYDPRIKTPTDLSSMKNFGKFREAVSKGLSFLDAYRLVNFEEITRNARAEAERAYKNAAGKSGFFRTHTHASPEEIPSGVMEYYRLMAPGATDAEIRRSWAKYVSKKR